MKRIVALLLSLMICLPPCFAKAVSLDVYEFDIKTNTASHPDRRMSKHYAPYFIDLRQRVEYAWQSIDPQVGCKVGVFIWINKDGSLRNIDAVYPPKNDQEYYALSAVSALFDKAYQPMPLPAMQGEVMAARVDFKSAYPRPEKAPSNGSGALDALLVAGLAAAAGFGIYASLKDKPSANQGTYQPNPGWHWVDNGRIRFMQTNPDGSAANNFGHSPVVLPSLRNGQPYIPYQPQAGQPVNLELWRQNNYGRPLHQFGPNQYWY